MISLIQRDKSSRTNIKNCSSKILHRHNFHPQGSHRTRHLLEKCLKSVTSSFPLLIIVDNVVPETDFDWLPKTLPENVKLIISTETQHLDILKAICEEKGSIFEVRNCHQLKAQIYLCLILSYLMSIYRVIKVVTAKAI